MFKVNNRDTRTAPDLQVSHILVMFPLLTLDKYVTPGSPLPVFSVTVWYCNFVGKLGLGSRTCEEDILLPFSEISERDHDHPLFSFIQILIGNCSSFYVKILVKK